MENSVKNSLKYLIGIVVLLLVLAAAFFGLANKSPAFDPEFVKQLMEENKSLAVELQVAVSTNSEYESTIALLEQRLEETTLDTSLNAGDKISADAELAACVVSDDVLDVQKRLIDTQTEFIACNNDLSNAKTELTNLTQTNKNLQDTLNESQLVEFEARVLQDQLAMVNTEYADLESRFNELLQQNQELVETISASAPLAFSDFTLEPIYCEQEFDPGWACVESIDIAADFNFAPSSDISVRLLDPLGDVIGSKRVTGREKNSIQFITATDEPLIIGQYTVEFRVDDEFSYDHNFDIVKP